LEIASPVILVDGYNVCGYWGKLKKDFMNGRQEIARQTLIDELVSFSAVRGLDHRIKPVIIMKMSQLRSLKRKRLLIMFPTYAIT
jgi:predicted RNA-binding protein with PIN domain